MNTGPALAVRDAQGLWPPEALADAAAALAERLRSRGVRLLATLMDNSAAWIAADLACEREGLVHLPLPGFFTPEQIAHALRSAGADHLLTLPAAASAMASGAPIPAFDVAGTSLALLPLPHAAVALPTGTGVVTFTSGTTGTPKGVCLGRAALQAVAAGLVQTLAPLGVQRHLSALPYAVLLEHVAGVMAPARQGAEVLALPLASLGLTGASGFDPARLHEAVVAHEAHSLILLPQMLRAWVGWLRATGQRAPASLRIVAVGGAAVGAPLVQAARALGLPACEGYGLSEGGSVQTLNLPEGLGPSPASRAGSAGRALPHARLRVAADGEIEVAGSLFLGYLGDEAAPPDWWPTGDLGHLDTDGFLHLRGRKKQVLITAYGRNVSPEWVETALRSHDAVLQAVVYGDGQPHLSAVLWPTRDGLPDAALQAAVDDANRGLPDYARVAHWVRARAAFSPASGLATPNGRPQRAAIATLHADALAAAVSPSSPAETQPDAQALL